MAEVFDLTNGATEMAAKDTGKRYITQVELDFVANPTGSGDTIKAVTIPAGYEVTEVTFLITDQEGAADTIDVGDSATADGYMDAAVIGASSGSALEGTLLIANGDVSVQTAFGTTRAAALDIATRKYYSAADYILITPSAALTALKGVLSVEMVRRAIA